MKITKRVREEAALICAVVASSGPRHAGGAYAVVALGASAKSEELAYLAWRAAWRGSSLLWWERAVVYAEAEALLRTGWSP